MAEKSKLDWLEEIEFEDLLTGDMKLIAERCGQDVLKSLMEKVPKIHVYMSEKPLVEAQKRYIAKNYKQGNAKEIAAKLGVSERFVYKVHREAYRKKRNKGDQPKEENLFQD